MIRLKRLLFVGTAALALIVNVPSGRAQWAVIDVANLTQNILTAARMLEEVNNQIVQIQQFVQMLEYEARNLASLPVGKLVNRVRPHPDQ